MDSIIQWNKNTVLRLPAEIPLEYRLLKPIGEGTYGKVYLAEHLRTGQKYAVKIVSLLNTSEGVPPTTMREMAFLKNFEHPNIVKLYRIFLGLESVAFVFELCGVDLGHILDGQIKGESYLPRGYVRCVMSQLVKALSAVHDANILHRDLKPQNVLLNRLDTQDNGGQLGGQLGGGQMGGQMGLPSVVKLADFGLSVMYGLSLPHEQKYCTAITLWYRPPELLLGEIYYNIESEIWSLGCLFLELLITHNIFNGNNECQQLRLIFSLIDLPDHHSPISGSQNLGSQISGSQSMGSQNLDDRLSILSEIFKDVDFKLLKFLHKPICHMKSRLRYYLPYMIDPITQDLVLRMLSLDPDQRIKMDDIINHQYFKSESHDIIPTIPPARFLHETQSLVPKIQPDDIIEPLSPEFIYEENLIRLANEAITRDYQN